MPEGLLNSFVIWKTKGGYWLRLGLDIRPATGRFRTEIYGLPWSGGYLVSSCISERTVFLSIGITTCFFHSNGCAL